MPESFVLPFPSDSLNNSTGPRPYSRYSGPLQRTPYTSVDLIFEIERSSKDLMVHQERTIFESVRPSFRIICAPGARDAGDAGDAGDGRDARDATQGR